MGIILTVKDMHTLSLALTESAYLQEMGAKAMKIPDTMSWDMKELQTKINKYIQSCRYLGMLDEEIFLTAAQLPERVKRRAERGEISVP
jgi:hypothetical protein